ncbi:MAG TPA: permease prefix domain 1-containing protein [Spirochaetia bacterium]|nr:permease prefix domain 1-containing protein [Spirochaetia bacterium]
MQAEVAIYLDEIRTHLHLDPQTESRIINELYTHLQEKVLELQEAGASEREAIREALASFGGARSIARLTYEAYSRGSWMEALISCQPHMIVAALFATHVWRQPVMVAAALAAILFIAVMASRRGTPTWSCSWMGYAAVPFLILTSMSWDPVVRTVTYVARGTGVPAPLWQLVLLGALCIFSIWLVASTTLKTARRDWILASLMLLPLPVLAIWLITISHSNGFVLNMLQSFEVRFSRWDTAMAYFCATLGVASVLFIRIRQRALKAGSILAVGIVGGAAVLRSFWGLAGLFELLLLSLALFAFLTSPLLLRRVGKETEVRFAAGLPESPRPSP